MTFEENDYIMYIFGEKETIWVPTEYDFVQLSKSYSIKPSKVMLFQCFCCSYLHAYIHIFIQYILLYYNLFCVLDVDHIGISC